MKRKQTLLATHFPVIFTFYSVSHLKPYSLINRENKKKKEIKSPSGKGNNLDTVGKQGSSLIFRVLSRVKAAVRRK